MQRDVALVVVADDDVVAVAGVVVAADGVGYVVVDCRCVAVDIVVADTAEVVE